MKKNKNKTTPTKKKPAAKHIKNDKSVVKSTNNMKTNSSNNKTNNHDKTMKKRQKIIVERSTGRHEKFNTNQMTQTVSRSGVPFLMARDVAKKVSNKITKEASSSSSGGGSGSSRQGSRIENNNDEKKKTYKEHRIGDNDSNIVNNVDNDSKQQQRLGGTEEKVVTASQIRGLVAEELRERNRGDIAASYSGQTPENTLGDQFSKQHENDRISVTGATQHTRQPANRNRVIHDMSKRGGGIST